MMPLLKTLQNWGCDVQDALGRTLGDEEFLLSCIQQVNEDPAFAELGEQLARGEVQAAFDSAHMLKGIIANMGLTPLYEQITQIVEPLRMGNGTGLEPAYERLMQKKHELDEILK